MQVYLLCAGGHCKQVIDIFENTGVEIIGIFDDLKSKGSLFYRGYKIIDTITNSHFYLNTTSNIFCTAGDNQIRNIICNSFLKYTFLNCISNKSNISRSVNIGWGNYVGDNCNILADTRIGNFNIINTNANIAHDIIIGDYNHIAPSSTLSGNICIGDLNLIGAHCVINPKIVIQNNNIIGSGSVIIKNINNDSKIVGNPGKIIPNKD